MPLTPWLLIAVAVLVGGALIFGLYAFLRRASERVEIRRLRKQGRTVNRAAARAMVSGGDHVFVVNKTSLAGRLWVLGRSVGAEWPLQTRLAEHGLVVEDLGVDGVDALTKDFPERTLICDQEVFDSS